MGRCPSSAADTPQGQRTSCCPRRHGRPPPWTLQAPQGPSQSRTALLSAATSVVSLSGGAAAGLRGLGVRHPLRHHRPAECCFPSWRGLWSPQQSCECLTVVARHLSRWGLHRPAQGGRPEECSQASRHDEPHRANDCTPVRSRSATSMFESKDSRQNFASLWIPLCPAGQKLPTPEAAKYSHQQKLAGGRPQRFQDDTLQAFETAGMRVMNMFNRCGT